MTAPILVDARGMRCPWPVLRLARAMATGAGGATGAGRATGTGGVTVIVDLLADDPAAPAEVAALAAERGWTVVPLAAQALGWRVISSVA